LAAARDRDLQGRADLRVHDIGGAEELTGHAVAKQDSVVLMELPGLTGNDRNLIRAWRDRRDRSANYRGLADAVPVPPDMQGIDLTIYLGVGFGLQVEVVIEVVLRAREAAVGPLNVFIPQAE
jgi:hypothetical protein